MEQHYSTYPASARVVAALEHKLVPYEVKKGTIKFPFSKPVPVTLIAVIAKSRAKEVAERQQATAAPPKKARSGR